MAQKSETVATSGKKLSPYNVLSKLDHDNRIYRKGSTVILTDAQAAPLIRLKVVTEAK